MGCLLTKTQVFCQQTKLLPSVWIPCGGLVSSDAFLERINRCHDARFSPLKNKESIEVGTRLRAESDLRARGLGDGIHVVVASHHSCWRGQNRLGERVL
jgi:hypothetical protein